MQTTSSKDKISLGRKAGLEILEKIKQAKNSVKIVSPYLSSSYLQELIKLADKGVKITLITADNLAEETSYSKFQESDIIKQEKKTANKELECKRKKGLRNSLIFFLISVFILTLSSLIQILFYPALFLITLSLIFTAYHYFTKTSSYKYYSIFRLKVFDSKSGEKPWSTNLVHSKIFLIDNNTLFLGSANFTYSAFNTHYETVIKVEDDKAIEDINREIENLFNSTDLKAKDIQEWGKEIYE